MDKRIEISDAIQEIKDLHYDLTRWVTGEILEDFSLIKQRQARDLTVVNVEGTMSLVSDFNKRYTTYYGEYKNVKIDADIIRTKRVDRKNILIVYRVTTDFGERHTSRMTTAILRFNENLRNKCEWTHVHETIINSSQ